MRSLHRLLSPSLVLLVACGGEVDATSKAAEQPRPVVLHVVTEEPLAPAVVATGLVGGKEEVSLSFKVGGVIARIAVDEGQRVAPGQVLAELSLVEIETAVAKAREGREKARRDLARVRALHADSLASLSQLQDATTALDVAEQDVRAVEFNRSFAVIRAPSAGVVLRRMAEPGAMTSPGAVILVLRNDRRGLVLRAGVADRDVMRLRLGDVATVTMDALPGVTIAGRVSQIAAGASAQTGTFEIEVALDPARQRLASGLIARAEIATRASGRYPMLPPEALVEAGGDSAIVFVAPPGQAVAQRRLVRISQVLPNGYSVVASGLTAGERVVVRGAAWLRDGSPMQLADSGGAR